MQGTVAWLDRLSVSLPFFDHLGQRHGVCTELHTKRDYLLYKTKLPYDVNQSKQDKSNGRDSRQNYADGDADPFDIHIFLFN